MPINCGEYPGKIPYEVDCSRWEANNISGTFTFDQFKNPVLEEHHVEIYPYLWRCEYCGSSNENSEKYCGQKELNYGCGAPRPKGR